MYCSKCGYKNENSAAFCLGCGQVITGANTDSPWRPAGDILCKEQQALPDNPVQPVYVTMTDQKQHSTRSSATECTAERKRKPRLLQIALPVISILGVLTIAFFAIRSFRPWFSIDSGDLCFDEIMWEIFDFGLFKDSVTLPHDSNGWNGKINGSFQNEMEKFREFEYDGTARELCENNPWIIYCLSKFNAQIHCNDFDILRMDGGMERISDDSPYNQKIISKDLFSGEYREYDAVFIETSYVVLNKNGDALCGFDNPSDLIYWAQTGIASTLYSKY